MKPAARLAPSLAFALVLASASSAAEPDWNQAEATARAVEVRTATQELYDAFYNQPPQNIGSGRSRAYLELKQRLRRVRLQSRHLASQLTAGEGQEETLPTYQNLLLEVRGAQENARRVYSTGPVIEKAAAALAALEKLARYYPSP